MRVLIVSQYFWPESFRINTIADALHGAGCQVSVLTAQPNYPAGKIFPGYKAWRANAERHPLGYSIFRVPIFLRASAGAIRLALNYASFVTAGILFGAWHLRKSQFDVIFVYGNSPILQALPAIFLRATKRAPVVFWVQDLWPESLSSTGYVQNSFVLGRVQKLVGWIYRRCDLILVQSRSFVERVTVLSGSVPVDYYPNPGDVEYRDGLSIKNDRIRLPQGFKVTFAGNLGTVQSLETILDAAERIKPDPDLHIVILGDGSRFSWLKKQVLARSLSNVHLLGQFDARDALDILGDSDALLITLNKNDGLTQTVPSKLVTYLGVGKPIIASMGGEGADIVKASGAGLVCEAENAEQLARLIMDMKTMPQGERDSMGAAGRRWYDEHFDLSKLTDRLIEHFKAAQKRWTATRTTVE